MSDKSATYRKTTLIEAAETGERLDRVLAKRFDDVSRAQLAKWINDGSILVDGKTAKPNLKLRGGEFVEIAGEFKPQQDWESTADIPITIVFEDEDVLVVEKPAGLVVHPGAATVAPTLANGLLALRPRLRDLPRVGIVHRLDKDTSGLLVVAASEAARVRLIEALARHEVSRVYLAVLEGKLQEDLEVNLPLGRSPRDRTRQTVRLDGREAITLLEVIAKFRAHTLARATLQTGRTHQIRVHAARSGLPLVGDRKYGAKRVVPHHAGPALRDLLGSFPRQALHAHRLAFTHPLSGEAMRFESKPPADLEALIRALRGDLAEHAT